MIINKNICLILTVALVMSLVFGTTVYASEGVDLIGTPAEISEPATENELLENEIINEEIAKYETVLLADVATLVDSFDASALGVNNIAKGKTATGGDNWMGYPASNLVDGKLNNLAAVELSKIKVDLGKGYNISHFGFVSGDEGAACGFNISFANKSDLSDAVCALNVGENETIEMNAEYIYAFTAPQTYRYVVIEGTTSQDLVSFKELYVYSDADITQSPWKITDKNGTTIKGAVAGQYLKTLAVTIDNFGSDKNAVFVVVMYDASGYVSKTATKPVLLSNGENKLDIDISLFTSTTAVPEGYTVKAFLMDTVSNGHLYANIYEDAAFTGSAGSGGAKKTYTVDVPAGCEFVTLTTIYKDTSIGIDDFSDFTTSNFNNIFYNIKSVAVEAGQATAELTANVKGIDRAGTYLTKITYVFADQSQTYSEYDEIINMSTTSVGTILGEIYASDAPLAKIGELAGYDMIDKALYEKSQAIASFNTYFKALRTEFYPEVYTGTADLETHLTKTIALDAFKNYPATNLANYISTTSFVNMFDASVNTSIVKSEGFATYFVASRNDSIVNFATLEKMLKATSGVYLMQGATNKSKAEILSTYGTALDLDLEKASTNGITLTQIARYIEGDSVSKVQQSYNKTLNNLIDAKNKPAQTTGGGGGGGTSVQDKVSVEVKEEPKPEIEVSETPKADESEDAPQYNAIFADVDKDHWAADAVYSLVKKGVISANQSNYRADDNVSRAEFIKLIVLALGMDMKGDEVSFDDATKNDWYYPYIVAGYNKGLIKGLTETHFGANDAISREDAAVIAQRALGSISINKDDLAFTDAYDISDYAIAAIKAMVDVKVLNGFEDGTFRPKNNITRAEAAVLINRLSKQ